MKNLSAIILAFAATSLTVLAGPTTNNAGPQVCSGTGTQCVGAHQSGGTTSLSVPVSVSPVPGKRSVRDLWPRAGPAMDMASLVAAIKSHNIPPAMKAAAIKAGFKFPNRRRAIEFFELTARAPPSHPAAAKPAPGKVSIPAAIQHLQGGAPLPAELHNAVIAAGIIPPPSHPQGFVAANKAGRRDALPEPNAFDLFAADLADGIYARDLLDYESDLAVDAHVRRAAGLAHLDGSRGLHDRDAQAGAYDYEAGLLSGRAPNVNHDDMQHLADTIAHDRKAEKFVMNAINNDPDVEHFTDRLAKTDAERW